MPHVDVPDKHFGVALGEARTLRTAKGAPGTQDWNVRNGNVRRWHSNKGRGPWRAAIKRTIVAAAPDLIVAEKVFACWTYLTDGSIHTAAGDQASDWRPPTLAERDLDGSWDFVPSGVPPSFSLRGVHSDSGSDDDSAASDADGAMQIVTANGTFSYTEDWNHIERSRHANSRCGEPPASRSTTHWHLPLVVHALAVRRSLTCWPLAQSRHRQNVQADAPAA